MRDLRLTVVSALVVGLSAPANGLATAFSYQGRLVDGGVPANGLYDLEFKLFEAAAAPPPDPIDTIIIEKVTVSGGLFTVQLDFGTRVFDGNDRWLEVGARPGGSGGSFTILTPRQQLTPAPYALFAPTAGTAVDISGGLAGEVTGNVTATVVSNAVSANSNNAIVRRDGSGGFAAGTLSLAGNLNLDNTTSASVGVITKGGSRFLHNHGTENTFLGALAGSTTFSGSSNVGVGSQALTSLSNGSGNIALGANAGQDLNNGSNNIYIGSSGGQSTESDTIRIGAAQNAVSLGSFNLRGNPGSGAMFLGSAVGPTFLPPETTWFGMDVLTNNSFGSGNTAFGSSGLRVLSSGSGNSAVGSHALRNLSSGSGNIALGLDAGYSLNNGSNNIYIGSSGGQSTESDTIRIGAAQNAVSLGSFNLRGNPGSGAMFLGNAVGPTFLPSETTWFGVDVLTNSTFGSGNTAFGSSGLRVLSSGSGNSAVGSHALRNLSSGSGNIALGLDAGYSLNNGSNNIYIGSSGGQSTESDTIRIGAAQNAVSLGSFNLRGNPGSGAMFLGNAVGPTFLPSETTWFGVDVLTNNTFGSGNTAFGSSGLRVLSSGSGNSAVGSHALRNLSSGSGNIALGLDAGYSLNNGSNNIYIGSSGGQSTESDTIRLGAGQTNTFLSGAVSMPSNASVAGNLSFGATTRQMLNLWSTVYGIGVQSGVMYFRTDVPANDGFAWYKGGAHSDNAYDPGGGSELMRINETGGLLVNGPVSATDFIFTSDRAAKQNVRPIDVGRVLDEVGRLPINEWSYKSDPGVRHVGPMAQDFRAAFGLGQDDRHIATVDAQGVALAAIQALDRRSKEQEAEIGRLKAQLEALTRQLETLLAGVNR